MIQNEAILAMLCALPAAKKNGPCYLKMDLNVGMAECMGLTIGFG